MTVDQVLDYLVGYLTGCTVDGGLLEGVNTVAKGNHMLSDAKKPAISVSWDGEQLDPSRGLMIQSNHQIGIRIFVDSLKKGDDPDALARAVYTGDNGDKGLRKALLFYPGGQGFAFILSQANPIQPDAFPRLRFSAGIEVLALVKLVTGR